MQPAVLISIVLTLAGIAMGVLVVVFPSAKYLFLYECILYVVVALLGLTVVRLLYVILFPPATPRPDMTIDQFVDDWLGYQRRRHGMSKASTGRVKDIIDGTHEALHAMAGQARLGHVEVWASRNSFLHGTVPLAPIPKEEWEDLTVDSLDLLGRDDTKEARAETSRTRNHDFYIDLHLNRAQVRKAWPRTRFLRQALRRLRLWWSRV